MEDYSGVELCKCDNCGSMFEADDKLTGWNWFIANVKIKDKSLRIYAELQDPPDSRAYESWHTFVCPDCLVKLLGEGI